MGYESRRAVRRVGTAVLSLIAFGAMGVACGGGVADREEPRKEVARFSNDRVRFDYPAKWDHAPGEATYERGAVVWNETFFVPGQGRSGEALRAGVAVAAFRVPVAVTPENIQRYRGELTAFLRQGADAIDAMLEGGLTPATVAGLPGFRYRIARPREQVEEQNVIFFLKTSLNESIQFQVKCIHSDEHRKEIEAGCREILDTFEVV